MKNKTQTTAAIILLGILAVLLYLGFFDTQNLIYCQIHHMSSMQTVFCILFLVLSLLTVLWMVYSNGTHAPGSKFLGILPEETETISNWTPFLAVAFLAIAFVVMYLGHNVECQQFLP